MLSVAVLSVGMATQAAAAAGVAPATPWLQCPAIGADTSCAVLIVQNADGSVDTFVDASQPPFDQGISALPEDTLIGFQNNGSSSVSSLPLTGSLTGDAAFAFDGDGICNTGSSTKYANAPAGCPFLDTVNLYGGPFVTFSGISSNQRSGTVNFTPAISAGGSTYFSLEGPSSSIAPPTKASPTITTSASPIGDQVVGTAIAVSDTATFHGTTSTAPTGSVSFTLFSDSTCLSTAVSGTGSISTTGGVSTASFSGSFTPTAPGTYQWIASYAGDPNNNGFTTVCGASGEQLTVIRASPTITTSASPIGDQVVGTAIAVSDTATFHGTTSTAPTGSVSFTLFSDSTCLSTAVSGTGSISTTGGVSTASFSGTFTPTAPGTYQWIAKYAGNANNNGFTTVCGASGEQLTVIQASPTITTSATANATVGGTMSDTATLSGGATPTGTITFTLFGPNNATCALPAAFTSINTTVSGDGNYSSAPFTPLLPGTYLWVATYSGDPNNNFATTMCGDTGETSAVFSFAPGGGSFVIGDKNAVVCSQKGGCTVTFWGAQWWKLNSLTGGPAPASFKGFAESPTTPICGAGWSSDTGNSTPPPAGPLPAFMAVIVTSHASQSGSTDSGDIVHIVIVHTNPGYAPDPGHAGTGTVVAVVC
jgi:hypothetical protein